MMKAPKKALHTFIILVALTNITFAREEWVDPHDMNIRVKPLRKEESKNFNREEHNPCNCNKKNFENENSFHLRKIIRLISGMTYFDKKSEVYKGVIDISLNIEDYDFLRSVMSDQLNDEQILRRLDEILDKSLEKNIYSTYLFSSIEYVSWIIFNETVLLCFGLLGVLYVLWKIQPHNYNFTTLIKLFLPVVYLSDFVLRYRAKLEEVEIDKYLEFESYKGCDPNSLSWTEWIYDKFTGYCRNNKKKYMLSQRAGIHLFTPLSVISEQLDVIVTFLKHLGAGLGSFMCSFMEQMPWYVKPYAAVLGFILVFFVLLMLGSYILRISPKFNLFHIFQFEISHPEPPKQNNENLTVKDSISGDNLRILLKSKCQANFIPGKSVQKNNSVTYKTKQKVSVRKRILKPIGFSNQKLLAISDREVDESETDE